MSNDKRTPLFDTHLALGARMAPFGGFTMPIQYTGIFKEHEATRTSATLFDTCHMGEFHLKGPTVIDDLETLLTCPVADLQQGQCRYGLLCNAAGGVIDDLLVYRIAQTEFMLVVNAGTQDGDADWIQRHIAPATQFENRSATTAKIDLQGPASPAIMNAMVEGGVMDLRFYRFKPSTYLGEPALVSRTGYTGEVGFEIYLSPEMAAAFWNDAMQRGATCAGLGARDTLRLEMGMPLYGHELTTTRNAADANFPRATASDKPFIGHNVIRDPNRQRDVLVGIRLDGRRAAREGDAILAPNVHQAEGTETPLGTVTSGSFAPSLGAAVAVGYIPRNHASAGSKLMLQTTRKTLKGTIVNMPFYDSGTARKPLDTFCG